MGDVYLVVVTIVGMVGSIAVSWGITKANLAEHRREIEEIKLYSVRKDYLHAITDPLQEHIREIQKDIKEILKVVTRDHGY